MKAIYFLGHDYEIIADLGGGWKLVAHPNGPAITDGTIFSAIDIFNGEALPPRDVKLKAQVAFREWAWPLLKDKFDF